MMELIFDTEYTDDTKAEAHRVPCRTWESTEEASSRPSKGGGYVLPQSSFFNFKFIIYIFSAGNIAIGLFLCLQSYLASFVIATFRSNLGFLKIS